ARARVRAGRAAAGPGDRAATHTGGRRARSGGPARFRPATYACGYRLTALRKCAGRVFGRPYLTPQGAPRQDRNPRRAAAQSQNIDLTLPRDRLVVITGLSGSGKSSLAFDTIYAEGQRRYVESLSSYARQFLGQM